MTSRASCMISNKYSQSIRLSWICAKTSKKKFDYIPDNVCLLLTVGEASNPSKSGNGNMRHIPIHAEDGGGGVVSMCRMLSVAALRPAFTSPFCGGEKKEKQHKQHTRQQA